MEYLIHYKKQAFIILFLIVGMSIDTTAQFEVYPNTNGSGYLDVSAFGDTFIELRSIEPGALLGSRLYMYKSNIFSKSRTITLDAGSNNTHGSLRLDAFIGLNPLTSANTTPAQAPYNMITLAKNTGFNDPQEYSWNIGIFDRMEFSGGVGGADGYDCIDCLTFAHQDGTGSPFYKFSFGSDADFQSASDARLKENIEDVKSTLDKIVKLTPKNYHYIWSKKNPNRKSSGFLAQDVQKIFPELVSSIRQPNGEKTLMLNYTGMIPYITKGMQEQQEIINNHEETISQLSDQINQLISQVNELREIMEK